MKAGPLLAAALLLAAGLLGAALWAVPGGVLQARAPEQSYDLSWHTVDGGGGMGSAGGTYVLGGTAGQGDAGLLTGGTFSLAGGFWGGGAAGARNAVYLPLVLRGP